MRDFTELKRLAEAATPYEWRYHQHHHPISNTYSYGICTDEYFGEWIASTTTSPSRDGEEADARFIAAANPVAVLDLIAEVERLRVCAAALWGLVGGVVLAAVTLALV